MGKGIARMESFSPFNSKFYFWGNRNYVQSSTLIYELFNAVKYWDLGSIQSFSASFHHLLRRQGTYYLYVKQKDLYLEKSRFCSIFDFKTASGNFIAGLEEGQAVISERTVDDEKELIVGCDLEPATMTATMRSFPPDRLFTVIVAMTKSIHQRIFPNQGFGNWLVGRFDFQITDDINYCKIQVKIINHLANRMTKSIIILDDTRAGEIYFNRQEI